MIIAYFVSQIKSKKVSVSLKHVGNNNNCLTCLENNKIYVYFTKQHMNAKMSGLQITKGQAWRQSCCPVKCVFARTQPILGRSNRNSLAIVVQLAWCFNTRQVTYTFSSKLI